MQKQTLNCWTSKNNTSLHPTTFSPLLFGTEKFLFTLPLLAIHLRLPCLHVFALLCFGVVCFFPPNQHLFFYLPLLSGQRVKMQKCQPNQTILSTMYHWKRPSGGKQKGSAARKNLDLQVLSCPPPPPTHELFNKNNKICFSIPLLCTCMNEFLFCVFTRMKVLILLMSLELVQNERRKPQIYLKLERFLCNSSCSLFHHSSLYWHAAFLLLVQTVIHNVMASARPTRTDLPLNPKLKKLAFKDMPNPFPDDDLRMSLENEHSCWIKPCTVFPTWKWLQDKYPRSCFKHRDSNMSRVQTEL